MAQTQQSDPSSETNDDAEGRVLLKRLCDNGFDSDLSNTALALGRETGELREMLDGEAPVDDDLIMKIRSIAEEREIKI